MIQFKTSWDDETTQNLIGHNLTNRLTVRRQNLDSWASSFFEAARIEPQAACFEAQALPLSRTLSQIYLVKLSTALLIFIILCFCFAILLGIIFRHQAIRVFPGYAKTYCWFQNGEKPLHQNVTSTYSSSVFEHCYKKELSLVVDMAR